MYMNTNKWSSYSYVEYQSLKKRCPCKQLLFGRHGATEHTQMQSACFLIKYININNVKYISALKNKNNTRTPNIQDVKDLISRLYSMANLFFKIWLVWKLEEK